MNSHFSTEQQEQALVSISSHPLYLEAKGHQYCVSEMFIWNRTDIGKMKIDAKDCHEITRKLKGEKHAFLITFFTAERKPEPLSGFGTQYCFILHPKTYGILHASTGLWKS